MRFPSRPSRRRLAAAALAPLVVLVAAGCSSTLENAATVTLPAAKGRAEVVSHITRDRLTDDLRTLRENDDFMEALSSQSTDGSASKGAVERRLENLWLNTLIEQVVIDAEVSERGIKVTDADREAVTAAVEEFYGGAKVFKKFPKSFREDAIGRSATWHALQTALGGAAEAPTEADARKFYEENFQSIASCESGLSVAHILVATQQEAQAISDELAGGADFATLARERSTDTVSAANGGELGCYQQGTFVTEFEQAVESAQVDVPTQPVQSQYGWHIVLVTKYEPPTFDAMKDQILQYLAEQASQAPDQKVVDELTARLKGAEVKVSPRYGTWVVDDQGARVEAPAAPEVRDERSPTSESTTTVPLSGVQG